MKRTIIIIIIFTAVSGMFFSCVDDEPLIMEETQTLNINELLSKGDPDWIELFNSSENELDISGYYLTDDLSELWAIPENTLINANGFLIIWCDDGNSGLHAPFKLSADGESLWLLDKEMNIIDQTNFPALNDGESWGRIPDGNGTFRILNNPSLALPNKEQAPTNELPLIENVSISNLQPPPGHDVDVSAIITDESGISEVIIHALFPKNDSLITMTSEGNNIYQATFESLEEESSIAFYIEAIDDSLASSFFPANAPEERIIISTITADTAHLVINEFLASNEACCTDPFGEYDDWIELYNPTDEYINIGGMFITDDLGESDKHQIPDTNPTETTIEPNGFIVLWADGQTEQGVLHLPFSLKASGEDIGIFKNDGTSPLDKLSYTEQQTDISYGRYPDGGDLWQNFLQPSPGSSNLP